MSLDTLTSFSGPALACKCDVRPGPAGCLCDEMDVLLPSRSTSPVLNAISLTTYPIPNGGGNSGRRLLAAEGTDAGSMHQPGAMQQPAAIQQPALRQPAALAPVPPPPPPRPPRRLARGELNALMHDAFRAEHQQARRRRALQQAADAPNSTGALPPPLPGTTPPPPAPVAPILDFASLSTVDGTGGSIYVVTTTGVELNKSAAVVNVLPADLAAQVEGIVGSSSRPSPSRPPPPTWTACGTRCSGSRWGWRARWPRTPPSAR